VKTRTLGIIGGSQAYRLLEERAFSGKRLGERGTPFGNSQPIYKLNTPTKNIVYFLSRHGENKYSVTAPFVNYRANIYALKDLGVEVIIAWTGPGAINTDYKIGDFVIIDDIIDETHSRASTFFENKGIGFIRMSEPFCPTLRRILKDTLTNLSAKTGIPACLNRRGETPVPSNLSFHDKGVYVCTHGPRLETKAEIRKYKTYKADLVGMTLAPEVFLAKELEMCYAALGYVTNYAEGVVEREYKKGELFEGMLLKKEAKKVDEAVHKFPEIINYITENINDYEFTCNCKDSMLRYKKRGDIGEDWREWVK